MEPHAWIMELHNQLWNSLIIGFCPLWFSILVILLFLIAFLAAFAQLHLYVYVCIKYNWIPKSSHVHDNRSMIIWLWTYELITHGAGSLHTALTQCIKLLILVVFVAIKSYVKILDSIIRSIFVMGHRGSISTDSDNFNRCCVFGTCEGFVNQNKVGRVYQRNDLWANF